MTPPKRTYLVFGSTGGTGKHFVTRALDAHHAVRTLARTPAKIPSTLSSNPNLSIWQGSITNISDNTLNELVTGVNYVVVMLGDKDAQRTAPINTTFMKRLVPCMRAHGVKRILYQAGGLSRPYGGDLGWLLWTLRKTLARAYEGQHVDNEGVMEYLVQECGDVEWIVHRAGINGDGESKGVLERSESSFSVANFRDCAEYSFRLVEEDDAVHSMDLSCYRK